MKRRNPFSIKRFLASPVTLIVVLVVFVVMARAAWTMIDRDRLSAARLDQAKAQYAKLEESQESLSGKVAELSSPSGVEADLREKYHAVMPGESVSVIVDSPSNGDSNNGQSAVAAQVSSTILTNSWWRRFLDFLGL